MNAGRVALLAALVLSVLAVVHAQSRTPEYTYQTVDINLDDFPLNAGDIVRQGLTAINDQGMAVGNFETDQNVLQHFTYLNGNFSLLLGDVGAVRGINNDGEMSGFASIRFPGRTENVGFVGDSALQMVRVLQAPGSNLTEIIGLNDKPNQLSVGDARNAKTGAFVGVVFRGGNFQRFVVAGSGPGLPTLNFPAATAVTAAPAFRQFFKNGKFKRFLDASNGDVTTSLLGVNNAGEIVGFFSDAAGSHPLYLHRDGSQDVNIESLLAGLPGISGPALPADISNRSEIAGSYVKGDTLSGFVFRNGNAFEIAFPGAETTEVSGINASGTVVGSYVAGQVRHGFIAFQN